MSSYLFSSHDGYGLGHIRRNTMIAEAVLALDPSAQVTLITGVRIRPSWTTDPRLRFVSVPPLLKASDGSYRSESLSFDDALAVRRRVFAELVRSERPDAVLVDRHPFGTAGELRDGLAEARSLGARVVLGLRDVLDEPSRIHAELAGDGWSGVSQQFDDIWVYGDPALCDHEREYGLPMRPTYQGWVVGRAAERRVVDPTVVVSAGGGGDGADVFRLGLGLPDELPDHRIVIAAGPYAGPVESGPAQRHVESGRLRVLVDAPGCSDLLAGASGVVQMAGYNSTVESIAAGLRPVLVPRRSPRREQVIRASRLAALGLADVVDEQAPADEVAWLLRRDRSLVAGQLAASGLRLDGAVQSARCLVERSALSGSAPATGRC